MQVKQILKEPPGRYFMLLIMGGFMASIYYLAYRNPYAIGMLNQINLNHTCQRKDLSPAPFPF